MDVTFVVEDGSGYATSTSYASIDELKQYFFNNNYAYESLSDNDIKRLLNNSTLYIDSNYSEVFPGYAQTETQRLLWPRSQAYYLTGYEIDENTIPQELKDAVCEMAYMINSGTDPFANIEKDGKVISSTKKVDVITTSVEYEEGSVLSQDIYVKIDSILHKLTGGVSNNFILSIVRVGGESP